MAKALVNYAMIFGLALMVCLIGVTMLSVDVDARHPEAPAIRKMYRTDGCEGTELWLAPGRGTVLALCGIPNSPMWGGIICRVTENNGARLLDGQAYEVTVFSAKRTYWDSVIVRDDYIPLANYPSVHRFFREWYIH